jgi:hypothetical protein
MAYTNSPETQTYKTVPIKFDGTPLYRDGDLSIQRDLQIVNMYYERVSQENKTRDLKLKKRPGLSASLYTLNKVLNTDDIRGSFYDPDPNLFYWSVENKVYAFNPDLGVTTPRTVCTLTTSTGYVGFCSFLKSDNTRYVIISDGIDLWYDNYVTTTCTSIAHAGNFPTPHQPYPIYLDGYIFLIKAGTGDIYNSVVDDVTTWTGSPITAEISSDYALRLVKAKNYMICLGTNSAEYFYDSGDHVAPSSPLSRNDSPVRNVGYVSNLVTIGDTTYFVGVDGQQGLSVYSINSFKIEKISNSVVDRTLQSFSTTSDAHGNINLLQDGYSITTDGHSFYVLVTPQTTWVYDIDDHFWYEWKGSDGTGLKVQAVWPMYNGNVYVGIANQSYISMLSPHSYQDFGANFTCRYTTENTTFGTMNWKVLHRLSLDCSKHRSSPTSQVVATLSYDDWSPDTTPIVKNINAFSNSPFTYRLGRFRNISIRFEYADNYPFFMTGCELDINVMGI